MRFSLTILGSSSALPKPDRFTTAHVLNAHERFYLIDCGEGTQIQLRRYKIRFSKIHHIFISHLHGDHFFGLFGLLSSFNLMGRKVPLNLYGPEKLKNILDAVYGNMGEKMNYTINFFPLNWQDKQLLLETEKISVYSFPLDHKIQSCGFLFKEKKQARNLIKTAKEDYDLGIKEIIQLKNGEDVKRDTGDILSYKLLTNKSFTPRSYAYVSDTRYYEPLVDHIRDVDLLYHEATYLEEMSSQAQLTGHSTSMEAARIAKMAKVKKLVIGHFSTRYKSTAPLLEEAQNIFPNTFAAADGMSFDVEKY
ncbi:MAG: ribonuclease Z [Bacteroidetes bacterium]|nr:ribonuclease Z [Bacteroidota bacterium]MBT4401101.1 ribonuclease Z [Bacteroidota bacterium]